MTFSLLTDENMSPFLVSRLWEAGCNTVAVRDRGMLRASDPDVWGYAMREWRTLVTINENDFVKLALREQTHPGLIIIPSGGTRERQFEYITAATNYVVTYRLFPPSFRDCAASVEEACAVSCKPCCALTNELGMAPVPASKATS